MLLLCLSLVLSREWLLFGVSLLSFYFCYGSGSNASKRHVETISGGAAMQFPASFIPSVVSMHELLILQPVQILLDQTAHDLILCNLVYSFHPTISHNHFPQSLHPIQLQRIIYALPICHETTYANTSATYASDT